MAKSASSNARSLERYRQKCDFATTTEPSGQVSAAGAASGALNFVVQKHAARRLHYDFRLELEGTVSLHPSFRVYVTFIREMMVPLTSQT